MKKIYWLIFSALLPFIAAGVYFLAGLNVGNVDVSNYSGDGVIRQLGSGFLNSGFEIVLEEHEVNKNKEASYQLENIPYLDKDYLLYFRLYDFDIDFFKNKKRHSGKIRVELSLNNNVVYEKDSQLSELQVTSVNDGETTDYYFYDEKFSSILQSSSSAEQGLKLSLTYIPIGKLLESSTKARFVIASGGGM